MSKQVAEVRPATKGHNLVVKVVEAKEVPARGRGNSKAAECIVGDATGAVVFVARNEQVDVAQPGAYLTLSNAKVEMFRGSMRLAVDKSGSVEVAEGQKFQPKTDNNLSLIEFELVTLDAPAA